MEQKQETTPTSESTKKGGSGLNIIAIIGAVLLGMFIVAGTAFFFIYSKVKTAIEDEIGAESFQEFIDSEINDLADSDLTGNIRRDAQIEAMLNQYDSVVAATAEDVSWAEYITELDAFIVLLTELTEIDSDPLIVAALAEFKLARQTYADAVKLDEPEAPVDEEGVNLAGEQIGTAQDSANAYLDKIGY